MIEVDLNSDVGEGFGNYTIGNDEEIMKYITTANVACGFHAGDPCVMRKTVELAKRNGVVVGAHPGFPDLMGFGRRVMRISDDDAWSYIIYQVGALKAFVEAAGLTLHHVKPHGALYSVLTTDEQLSRVVAEAILKIDPGLPVYFPAPLSQAFPRIAKEMGLRVVGEVNADTDYTPDGAVVVQRAKHALDPEVARKKVRKFIAEGTVTATNGKDIRMEAESICIHGDTPNAIDVVKAVRDELKKAKVAIAPFKRSSSPAKPKSKS